MAITAASSPALARDLRGVDVVALTINNVIGAGIFTMPSALAAGAGSASLAILLLTIVVVSMMALCLVEVASRFDKTGGPMIYASEAFGANTGFVVGWLMYLSRLSAFGAIVVVMFDYAAGLWPALGVPAMRVAAITILIVILAAINVRGVARGARASRLFAALKLAPLIVVAAFGVWTASSLSASLPPPQRISDLGGAALVALFACMGFETGAVVAGEVRNPRRDLAAGTLGGFGGVAILYALLMIVCLRLVPDLAHSTRPVAAAASVLFGSGGAVAVSMTAVVSCAGTLTVIMISAPRVLYALAAQGDMPAPCASVNPVRRTPAVAILGSALIIWLLTVSGTFIYLATFSAMARLLMYASTCAALIVLRRRDGAAPVPIPGGPVLGVLSLVATLAAIAATTGVELRDLAIAVVLGWAGRAVVRRWNRAIGSAASPSA